MKATELLQKQHRDIEGHLDRLRAAGQADEQRIRQDLAACLVAHTVIEEELFYPAVREAMPEEILEAVEEHGLADVQLARLLAARLGEDDLEARASVLAEIVIRHIRREESDVFKVADRELGDEHLNELGDQMAQRHRQVLETGYTALLQAALEQEVPRTPGRGAAAKKTARRRAPAKAARRGAAAKKVARGVTKKMPRGAATKKMPRGAATKKMPRGAATKKAQTNGRSAAKPIQATSRRAPTKRASVKRATPKAARPAEKPARPTRAPRGSAGATRTMA
jgi:hypothetical protein